VKAVEKMNGLKPDCVIIAVAHEQFGRMGEELGMAVRGCPVVVDIKGALKESGKRSL
jgi:hypothetical protein